MICRMIRRGRCLNSAWARRASTFCGDGGVDFVSPRLQKRSCPYLTCRNPCPHNRSIPMCSTAKEEFQSRPSSGPLADSRLRFDTGSAPILWPGSTSSTAARCMRHPKLGYSFICSGQRFSADQCQGRNTILSIYSLDGDTKISSTGQSADQLDSEARRTLHPQAEQRKGDPKTNGARQPKRGGQTQWRRKIAPTRSITRARSHWRKYEFADGRNDDVSSSGQGCALSWTQARIPCGSICQEQGTQSSASQTWDYVKICFDQAKRPTKLDSKQTIV